MEIQLRNLILDILDNTYLMSLATVSENKPWVSDVIFVYDDKFNIYWLSRPETRHSTNIKTNSNISASITLSTEQGEENKGLQISGMARKVEGDILEMSEKHCIKRKKPILKEGEILQRRGESWYVFKPSRIEIIYEPLFGFTKQIIELD